MNNPFGNAPSSAPLFTVSQLQDLQRQMAQQQQQQSMQQNPQVQQPSSNSRNAATAAVPFVIMTQVPMQVTPFAFNGLQLQNSVQQAPVQQAPVQLGAQAQVPTQQQQRPPLDVWSANAVNKTTFTPLRQQQLQQQQLQQQHQQQPPVPVPVPPPMHHQPVQQTPPQSQSDILQQLMRNAYQAQQANQATHQANLQQQAVLQADQQQQASAGWQPLGSVPIDTGASVATASHGTQQQQALYTLGSRVKPLQQSQSNLHDSFSSLEGWQNCWDEPGDIQKSGSETGKRKLVEDSHRQQQKQDHVQQQQQPQPMVTSRDSPPLVSMHHRQQQKQNDVQQQQQPQPMVTSRDSPPLVSMQQPQHPGLGFPQAPLSSSAAIQTTASGSMDYTCTPRDSSHGNADDSMPTPLHEMQSRHVQYQQHHQHQQHQQHALPTMSSTPAQVPSSMELEQHQRRQQAQVQQQQQALNQAQVQQQQVAQHQAQVQQQAHQRNQQHAQQSSTSLKLQEVKSKTQGLPTLSPAPSNDNNKNPAFVLPTIMMPPSVLTSVLTSQKVAHTDQSSNSTSSGNAFCKKSGTKSMRREAPQDTLQRMLSMRGYGKNIRIKSDAANYDTVPSGLQLASFGTELVKAIHTSDAPKLSKLLGCGLSPNPCNQFRDSIVDLVCKRANSEIFHCLVDNGCDLQVCDAFGRTPLHHCCWASEFCEEIALSIIRRDWLQLLIEDKRGQTPLEYVRANVASDWVNFFEAREDELFPVGGVIPALDRLKGSRPDSVMPDPPNALPIQLAQAVSSGEMSPEEVLDLSPGMRERFE